MKKRWKIFVLFLVLIFTGLIAWIIIAGAVYTRDYYLSLLRYSWSPEMVSFIKEYEQKIKNPVSKTENDKFNKLYDDTRTITIWSNYQALQNDLTTTNIGGHSIDINWVKLYQNVGLKSSAIEKAKQQQLRFYNIIAKLYNKNIILCLLQSAKLGPMKKNEMAVNEHSRFFNSQRQIYGSDFANTNMINHAYQTGQWSTNQIISTSAHEYGHALDFFLQSDNNKRKTFNNNWSWLSTNILPLINNNTSKTNTYYSPVLSQYLKGIQIPDCTQKLMTYLDDRVGIDKKSNEKRRVFPLIIVQSTYARSFYFNKNPQQKMEFFAEAFAEWLLTPQSLRGWNWELLNGFFMDELPKYL